MPTDEAEGEVPDSQPRARAAADSHRLQTIEETENESVQGSADGTGLRIAIACSRFNGNVTGQLLSGALAELARNGVAEADRAVVWVPGAFELPLAALVLARTGRYEAIICLGAVIRGETSHYDFVAGECAAGIQRVQLEVGLPVVFGVLTTENRDQALARAGGAVGNKGTDAATTAVEMANVLRQVESTKGGIPGREGSVAPGSMRSAS